MEEILKIGNKKNCYTVVVVQAGVGGYRLLVLKGVLIENATKGVNL